MDFEYSVSEMKTFLVINLKGRITKESKDNLQACLDKSIAFKDKNVIVILKDVVGVDHSMSRDFTLFQQIIRGLNKTFFLIGLKKQLKEELQGRGLLRVHELKNSVADLGFKVA